MKDCLLRKAFCSVLSLSLFHLAYAQVTQEGIAYYYDYQTETKTPLGNVSIAVVNAQPELSEEDGTFTLRFSKEETMGNKIVLSRQPECRGLKVFNQSTVDNWHIIREPLELIMCKYSDYELSKQFFFNQGYRRAEQEFLKREEEIRKQEEDRLSRIIGQTDNQFDSYIKRLDTNADKLARVDRSVLSEEMRAILDEYDKGMFDEAMGNLEALGLLEKLTRLSDERKSGARSYKQDKEFLALARDVRIAASLLENQAKWDEAGLYLKALADKVESIEDYYSYASFCYSQVRTEDATYYYQLLLDRIADSNDYLIERCAALKSIGKFLLSSDRPDDAKPYMEDALELARTMYSRPSYDTLFEYIDALVHMSAYYCFIHDFIQAEKYCLRAEDVILESDNEEFRELLASTYENIAHVYLYFGRSEKGIEYSSLAIDAYSSLLENSSEKDEIFLMDIIPSYLFKGYSLSLCSEYEAAEKVFLKIAPELERLSDEKFGWYGYYYALCLRMLAGNYLFRFKYPEALDYYRKALETFNRLDLQSPDFSLEDKYGLLRDYATLLVKIKPGEEETMAVLYDLLILIDKRANKIPPSMAWLKVEMNSTVAMLYLKCGDFSECERILTRALSQYEELSENSSVNLKTGRELYGNLAELNFKKGSWHEARSYYQKGIDIARNMALSDKNDVKYLVDYLIQRGKLEYKCGNYKESEELFLEAKILCNKYEEVDYYRMRSERFTSNAFLLQIYNAIRNVERINPIVTEILDNICEEDQVPEYMLLVEAEALSLISTLYIVQPEVLSPIIEKPLASIEGMDFIPRDLFNVYLNCKCALALLMEEEGRYSVAEDYVKTSISLIKKHYDDVIPGDLLIEVPYAFLGNLYSKLDREAEFVELLSKDFSYIRRRAKTMIDSNQVEVDDYNILKCYLSYAFSAMNTGNLPLAESLFKETSSLLSELPDYSTTKDIHIIGYYLGLYNLSVKKGENDWSLMMKAAEFLKSALDRGRLDLTSSSSLSEEAFYVILLSCGQYCLNEGLYDNCLAYLQLILQQIPEREKKKQEAKVEVATAKWLLSICYEKKGSMQECWYYAKEAALDFEKLYMKNPDGYIEIYCEVLEKCFSLNRYYESTEDLLHLGEKLIAITDSEGTKAEVYSLLSTRYESEGDVSRAFDYMLSAHNSIKSIYKETNRVKELNDYLYSGILCMQLTDKVNESYAIGEETWSFLISTPEYEETFLPNRIALLLLLGNSCLHKDFIEDAKDYINRGLVLSRRLLENVDEDTDEDWLKELSTNLMIISNKFIENGEHEFSLNIYRITLNIITRLLETNISYHELYEKISYQIAGQLEALDRIEESIEVLFGIVEVERNFIDRAIKDDAVDITYILNEAFEKMKDLAKPIAKEKDCRNAIVHFYTLPEAVLLKTINSSINTLITSAGVLEGTEWKHEQECCLKIALGLIESSEEHLQRFYPQRFYITFCLGKFYHKNDMVELAYENYLKADSLYSALSGDERELFIEEYYLTCVNLSIILMPSREEDAVVYMEKAVRLLKGRENDLGPESLYVLYQMMSVLYQHYREKGRDDLAAEYGRRALQVCPVTVPGWDSEMVDELIDFSLNLGDYQYETGRYEDAVQTYEFFISLLYDPLKEYEESVNRAYYAIFSRLESLYTSLSRSADAERAKQRKIKIEKKLNSTERTTILQ